MSAKTRKSVKISDPFQFANVHQKHHDKIEAQLIEYNNETYSENNNFEINDLQPLTHTGHVSWLNFHGLHEPALIRQACERLSLHRMIVQDILDPNQRPKVQLFDEYLFFTVRAMRLNEYNEETELIAFVLGENYLTSFQEVKGDHFGHIRERIRNKKGMVRERNADYLLYLLLEAILESYFNAIDRLEKQVNLITSIEYIEKSDTGLIVEIEKLRDRIFRMKKDIIPQKEAIGILEKGLSPLIAAKEVKYYYDLKDQCAQVVDELDYLVQRLDSSTNLFYTYQGNRLNLVMKTLTVVATIFIPLTFVVGIYGMNFDHMPELHWKYGYFIIMGVMGAIFFGMLWYFKRKNWF
jgi:magnesium transporter